MKRTCYTINRGLIGFKLLGSGSERKHNHFLNKSITLLIKNPSPHVIKSEMKVINRKVGEGIERVDGRRLERR